VCCSLLSSTSKMSRTCEHGLVTGCHICKKSVRDNATLLKLPESMVGGVTVKWKCDSTTITKPGSGRLRFMTDKGRWVLKKVVRETRQTWSETLTHEFHSAMNCPASTMTERWELRGMGLHGLAPAHKPNILPVYIKRCLILCKEWRYWTVDNWKRDLGWWIMLYHVPVRREALDVVNFWRTIPSSLSTANSKIWRWWHYSEGVFFTEWTWPPHNTAWKSKHRRIQWHSDPMHTVCARRPVQWRLLSVSARQCSLP
jgi:hypothetical protein